jgi:DNA-binding NtrC family response regulator
MHDPGSSGLRVLDRIAFARASRATIRPAVSLKTTAERTNPRVEREALVAVVHWLGSPGDWWRPRALVLRAPRVAVGRAAVEGDIAFPEDPFVSRHHATLEVDPRLRAARLIDHSRTGTFVAGRQIREAALGEGEPVRVGDSFFLLRFEPEFGHGADPSHDFGLVGVSAALGSIHRTLAQVAPSGASVLILGESGTGKELAARAVHVGSRRAGPFVAVNCGAIPEALAESQLFGHVAGAFTGARGDSPGLFRSSNGGTLFLDEIGELPLAVQAKLLRAVETRQVVPVGATQPVTCDVRLVAATNRELRDPERFRGDLLARISDFVIEMPPLRARREDVLPMLTAMLEGKRADLEPELANSLLLDSYPHNARDLRRIAVQLKLRGAGLTVWTRALIDNYSLSSPPPPGDSVPAPAPAPRPTRTSAPTLDPRPSADGEDDRDEGAEGVPTREELEALLHAHRGVVADVARATGRSRKQVYRWLEQRGLGELRKSLLDK